MFSNTFREFRHNPCLMAPPTFLGVLLLGIFWAFAFVWKFPLLVLGFLLSPLVNRTQFIIEFLYPWGIGRWVHLTISRLIGSSMHGKGSSEKNKGFHSRSVETRIEVVPGRLYIHPLPQLLDNIGYLVVSLPEENVVTVVDTRNKDKITTKTKQNVSPARIVAFIVDCGDAAACMKHIQLISEAHYQKKKIVVQAILSTHKHHDHTAGNIPFLKHQDTKEDLKIIVGGAVEKIPGCNFPVENGDIVPLPKRGGNQMDELVEIEAVATPAHTRGSITYVMRLKPEFLMKNSALAFLFTGDTMFSAGGGVPFEADIDVGQEAKEPKQTFVNIVKASASIYAVERCFGEILARSSKSKALPQNINDRLLIMPGHEYSHELLSRQLSASNGSENCRWKNFSPHTFFETASQYYIALHRKTLPHSSGKLLTAVGSPISLEMNINPHLRSMRKRGELIVQAIHFWHKHFCRDPVPERIDPSFFAYFENPRSNSRKNLIYSKSESSETQWTLDATDLRAPVFSTVYASDLDSVIHDLQMGLLTPQEGAQRLRSLKEYVKESVVTRRPVPGTLPSDRAVYRGLLALALLGSSPAALTFSDSERMKLPKPIHKTSDNIEVSRRHLISVLQCLGLLTLERDGPRLVAMIHQLWKEALQDGSSSSKDGASGKKNYDTIDPEVDQHDIVSLGSLKWSLYGVPRQQSSASYCLPCVRPRRIDRKHPVHATNMKSTSGEIVRHDVYECHLCKSRAGVQHFPTGNEGNLSESVANKPTRPVVARIANAGPEEDGNDGLSVEVTSILKEV